LFFVLETVIRVQNAKLPAGGAMHHYLAVLTEAADGISLARMNRQFGVDKPIWVTARPIRLSGSTL